MTMPDPATYYFTPLLIKALFKIYTAGIFEAIFWYLFVWIPSFFFFSKYLRMFYFVYRFETRAHEFGGREGVCRAHTMRWTNFWLLTCQIHLEKGLIREEGCNCEGCALDLEKVNEFLASVTFESECAADYYIIGQFRWLWCKEFEQVNYGSIRFQAHKSQVRLCRWKIEKNLVFRSSMVYCS